MRSPVEHIFHSPNERRLRAGWRLLAQALIFAVFAVLVSAVIFPMLPEGEAFWLVEEVVRLVAIAIPVMLARRFFDHRSFTSLGLSWSRRAAWDILAGFLISGISLTLLFGIYWGMGWLKVEGFAWQNESWTNLLAGVGIMFLVWALTAMGEELQVRGYWLQNLEDGLNLPWAFILSSLFFAAMHFANQGFSLLAFLGLFVGSFDLAYGYIRTRQLWLPIGLHLGWNFFEGTIYGFQVSGLEGAPRLLLQSVAGPELWTGGGFGPEAGLLMLLAVAVDVGLIYIYIKNADKHNLLTQKTSN